MSAHVEVPHAKLTQSMVKLKLAAPLDRRHDNTGLIIILLEALVCRRFKTLKALVCLRMFKVRSLHGVKLVLTVPFYCLVRLTISYVN